MTWWHFFRPAGRKTSDLVGRGKSIASAAAPRNFRPMSMAEYIPVTEKFGNLVAICPDCDAIMNRRVSLAKIGQIRGKWTSVFRKHWNT